MNAYLLNFILLAPCFSSLFWGIILLSRRGKNYKAQNVLAISLLNSSVTFFLYGGYFISGNDCSRSSDIIYALCSLSIYPFYILYFKLLTDGRRLRWWNYILFAPALLLAGMIFVCYLLMGEGNSLRYVRECFIYDGKTELMTSDTLFRVQSFLNTTAFNVILVLQAIYTIICIPVRLSRYRRSLNEFYSNREGKSIENHYLVLGCIGFTSLLTFITTLISRDIYVFSPFSLSMIFILYAVTIFVIVYCGFNLKYTIEDLIRLQAETDSGVTGLSSVEAMRFGVAGETVQMKDLQVDDRQTFHATVHDEKKKGYNPDLVERLSRLMAEEKIYLKNDLRLDEVAVMLHTNRCYISRLINEEYCCTFSEYINRYRIMYAQELMRTDSTMIQEAVASLSGFLHVTTFSRTFKRQVGMAPGEWKKLV